MTPLRPRCGRDVVAAGLRCARQPAIGWREALLSTVAASAMSLAIAGPAGATPLLCATRGA
jgi:hypothetical protein